MNDQIGNGGKEIPLFNEPINSPYINSNQRKNYNKMNEQTEKPQFTKQYDKPNDKPNDKLLLDLQLYQEQKKPPQSSLADKMIMPVQPAALTSIYTPPQFQNYLNTAMKHLYTPFIYKDYNIQIGGPNADHMMASRVYQDALPDSSIFSSYKSLQERINLSEFIRGTFIQQQEGENVDFSGGPNSLNSKLNLIKLNPFDNNQFSSNPYLGLSKNILIYNSCYPIIYDNDNFITKCNKDSVGINIRVYRLTKAEALFIGEGVDKIMNIDKILKIELKKQKLKNLYREYKSFNIDDNIIREALSTINTIDYEDDIPLNLTKSYKKVEFNAWREIEYYNFIKNNICKPYISPNFIQSYCYFVNRNANIKWYDEDKPTQVLLDINNELIGDLDLSNYDNFKYSTSNIVLLTESPNYNFNTWCSNIYETDRNIKTQIYTGFKPTNAWFSVFAQMMTVFYVMDRYKFTINDMDITRNFYLKDLSTNPDAVQYWKYNINGIDYYIPNFGSLLLVDTDYHDIENKEYKILAEFLNDDKDCIKKKVRLNALKCFNPNNFGPNFKNIGGIRPSEEIINLLEKICKDLQNTELTFEDIMKEHFIKYIHNRVGTKLRINEQPYICRLTTQQFKKGELVVYLKSYEDYRVLLYIEDLNDGSYNCKCGSRDDENINSQLIEIIVGKDLLRHYSEIIYQDKVPGEPSLNQDYLIETYIL